MLVASRKYMINLKNPKIHSAIEINTFFEEIKNIMYNLIKS